MNLGSAAATAPMAGGCAPMVPALPVNQTVPEVLGHRLNQTATQSPAAPTTRLGEQFARALEEQGGDDDAAPPRETESPAGLLPWPPAPPPPSIGMAPTPAPLAGAAGASSDAVAAAAKSHEVAAAAPPATVAQADAGQVWELSLNEPDGLVLSLRAERVAQPASISGNPPPGWTLAITAPAAEAAALQRHAPRLAERLAARALAPAHLRIAGERESRGE
jgi:hypothetical protein